MIKILVVDDEPGICHILKKTFMPMGFTVLTANSGEEALDIVRKQNPRIIFLDIRMLGFSGLDVLKELKENDSRARVNMVTVLDDKETKEEAKRLGADEFITKPFVSDYLEEVVRKQVADLIRERP